MGVMPPYNPFEDSALSWAIARVNGCNPPSATWASPSIVEFDIESLLRGELPRVVHAIFDAPRESQQSRFYASRGLGPNPTEAELAAVSAQHAALDATPIELPTIGAKVIVWFGEHVAAGASEPGLPPAALLMSTSSLVLPPEGAWRIPTLRLFAPSTLGAALRSRWIEYTSEREREVRGLLARVKG
ncbi:MAG: hypothetical protein JNK05_00040 [Myxococcales bacterium]|nr:hypothetical protein [Myxococcales bacterium]